MTANHPRSLQGRLRFQRRFSPDVGVRPQHLLRLRLRRRRSARVVKKPGRPRNSFATLVPASSSVVTSPTRVRYRQARGRSNLAGNALALGEASGCPITARAADLWLMIDGLRRSRAHAYRAISTSSVVTARVRRLARTLASPYAARNLSIEKTVPRDSM